MIILPVKKLLNSSLNLNYNFSSEKNSGIYNLNNYFENINEFIKGSRLKQNLINNKNFQEFLIKYIKKHKIKDKYIFIHKTLNNINNKNYVEMNNYLDNIFKEQIRNGIINYYNFDYIDFDKYFLDYIKSKENNKNNNEYLLNSSPNFTLYQLLNINKKNIETNNNYCSEHNFLNYLEKDTSFLNKFQIYKIYNSFNTIPRKKTNKLLPFKPMVNKISNSYNPYGNNYDNSYDLKPNKDKNQEKIVGLPNFDNIFGQILNDQDFINLKPELNNVESKRELCSESKKFKFKKIKKDTSPFQKLSNPTVGRNSSYYNHINNPFQNNNLKDKKKILHLSNGNEFGKSTQSFKEKKNVEKSSKNKIIKANIGAVMVEPDEQINNFKERSGKRKYTYNQEESKKALKKITNNNHNLKNNFIFNNNKDVLHGPISSTKKYENNYGHLPKLAGDLDDELLSDDDSFK